MQSSSEDTPDGQPILADKQPEARNVWQFSLATVFWVITGTAIAMSLSSWIPGRGLLLAVTCTGSLWAIAATRSRFHKLAFSLAAIAAGPIVAWLLLQPLSPCSHYVLMMFTGELFGKSISGPETISISMELCHGLTVSLAILAAAWIVRRKLRKAQGGTIWVLGLLMSIIASVLYIPLYLLGLLGWGLCGLLPGISMSSIDYFGVAIATVLMLVLLLPAIITICLLSFHVCGLPLTLLAWILRRLDPIEAELTDEDWSLIEAIENMRAKKTDPAQYPKKLDFNYSKTRSYLWRLMRLGVIDGDYDGYFYCGLSRFRKHPQSKIAENKCDTP